MSALTLDQLKPEDRKRALQAAGRKRAPRRTDFPKDRARTYAIRTLAVTAELSPAHRRRVLQLALAMNEV